MIRTYVVIKQPSLTLLGLGHHFFTKRENIRNKMLNKFLLKYFLQNSNIFRENCEKSFLRNMVIFEGNGSSDENEYNHSYEVVNVMRSKKVYTKSENMILRKHHLK